jgi:hypothetical protein
MSLNIPSVYLLKEALEAMEWDGREQQASR